MDPMGTKICYQCRERDVDLEAEVCPHCGAKFRRGTRPSGLANKPRPPIGPWLQIAGMLLLIGGAVLFIRNMGRPDFRARVLNFLK